VRKILVLLLFFGLAVLISGCSSMSNYETNRLMNQLEQSSSSKAKEITLDCSYEEAFLTVTSVFHDLCIHMPKKDFDGKKILGISHIARAFSEAGGSERYVVSFQAENNKVKLTIRTIPFIKYEYNDEFIAEKILEEDALQKRLTGDKKQRI